MPHASHQLPSFLVDSGPQWFDQLVFRLRHTLSFLNSEFASHATDDPCQIALMLLPYQLDELVSVFRVDVSPTAPVADDVDLHRLMTLAVVASRPLTSAYPFRTEVEPTSVTLRAPQSWLFRIFTNLTSNAIKHSKGDNVELFVTTRGSYVILNVRDNGRGMDRDLIDALLSQQYYSDTKLHAIGTLRGGRGVATAMLLARAMKGKVDLLSSKNGTHWQVYLPAVPAAHLHLPTALRSDLGWINGVIHDVRQPLNALSARASAGGYSEAAIAAIVRLPYLFDELISLVSAGISATGAVPAESFVVSEVMEAAVAASSALASHAASSTTVDDIETTPVASTSSTDLVVSCPKSWIFRMLSAMTVGHLARGRDVRLSAHYDDGMVCFRADPGKCRCPLPSIGVELQIEVARHFARALGGDLEYDPVDPDAPILASVGVRVIVVPAYTPVLREQQPLSGKTVVILDDSFDLAVSVAARFEELGARALVFTDDLDMLTATLHMSTKPDLYVLDFMLESRFVTRALSKLRARRHPSHIVILTAHPNHPALREFDPPVPVVTKLLTDMSFRSLVALLRGEIADLSADHTARSSALVGA